MARADRKENGVDAEGGDSTKPWKAYPADRYADVARSLSHLGTKGVNSNASMFGIRVAANEVRPGPYVAVSTLGGANVPLDYSGGAANAGVAAQILSVLRPGQGRQYTAAPTQDLKAIEAIAPLVDEASTVGDDVVDPRLRQVLLPRQDGSYVAVSPLHAFGLTACLRAALDKERAEEGRGAKEGEESADHPKTRPTRRKIAHIPFGGKNPQNLSLHGVQTALVFDAPKESPEMRRAYALHFNGISLKPSYKTLADFYQWQASRGDKTTMRLRIKEAKHVERMVDSVILRAKSASRLLTENFDGNVADGVSRLVRGMLFGEHRYPGWRQEAAAAIARHIADFRPRHGDRMSFTPLSDSGISVLQPEIEGFLLSRGF